jgi:multiple sugar transport system substrate-binding protein
MNASQRPRPGGPRSIWRAALAALAVSAGAVTGCAPLRGAGASATGARLQLMIWGERAEERLVRDMVSEFERQHAGVRVDLLHVPASYDEKLMILMAAGTPPDVMYVNLDELELYARAGALLDLAPFAARRPGGLDLGLLYPELVEAFTSAGRLAAIPKDFSPLVLYYNRDLFERAGLALPDESWTRDDLVAAARALTRDLDRDGRVDVYGVLIEPATAYLAPWVRAAGGEFFDRRQVRWVMGDPDHLAASADGVRFFAELFHEHRVTPPPPVGTTLLGYAERFPAGTAAMAIYGHWKVLTFAPITAFRWGVTQLPATRRPDGTLHRASPLYAVGYGIASRSRHPELAWQLVAHLTGEAAQRTIARAGLAVPAHVRVAESADFLAMPGLPHLDKRAFVRSIRHGRPMPNHPAWKEMKTRLEWDLDLVVRGRLPARQALARLQAPMEALVAQYGKGSASEGGAGR